MGLWAAGYAATDIIQTLFKVSERAESGEALQHCRHSTLLVAVLIPSLYNLFSPQVTRALEMPETQKLDFIREIGFSHMRIAQGLNTQLQLLGCIARLSQLTQQ